jgi:hypothetical protein
MDKHIYIDDKLDSYKTFLDHEWARRIDQQTSGTPLEEIFFDLQWAWKGAANTFYMPWLTVTTMVAAGLGAAKDHAFPSRFTAALTDKLVQRMGLNNMTTKRLVKELRQISEEVRAEEERPPVVETEMVWRTMLTQSEFQLSIWGSQRLCFAAVYYAYEDFLARCYRLTAGRPDYRVGKGFTQDFRDQFSPALRDACWSDAAINIARLTRHALVHNGGRLTSDLKKLNNHGLKLHGEDIQIFPAFTKSLYDLLKVRVTKFLSDPAGPLAKLGKTFVMSAFQTP